MIVIPSDLPTGLAPLAWLLGRWQGWGMHARPAVEEDVPVVEQIEAEVIGERVRLVISLWTARVRTGADLDPQSTAAEGLDVLEAGDLLREETTYLRVLPGSGVLPEPGEVEPREFTASGGDSEGLGTLWAGVVMGPRIQMVTDAVARGASAEPVEHMGRMFGLVGGELMWTQERRLEGGDTGIEFSGRLERVAGIEAVGGSDE